MPQSLRHSSFQESCPMCCSQGQSSPFLMLLASGEHGLRKCYAHWLPSLGDKYGGLEQHPVHEVCASLTGRGWLAISAVVNTAWMCTHLHHQYLSL